MAQNICFYSNKCDWSKAFLKEIAQTSFKNSFTYISIDKDASGKLANLPDWLKKVPTLVIKGDPEPIKTDAEVMNWLYMEKMRVAGPKQGSAMASAEPEAWMNQEMSGGMKDAYSFIGGQESEIISRNFEMIGSPGTRTGSDIPGASGGGEKKTAKEELFDKQMESYMKNREGGMPQQRPRQ